MRLKNASLRDKIQDACVRYMNVAYPEVALLLIEARRTVAHAVNGMADMVLLVPSGEYASLCITVRSRIELTTEQQDWREFARMCHNCYVVIDTLDDFIREVSSYLNKTDFVQQYGYE